RSAPRLRNTRHVDLQSDVPIVDILAFEIDDAVMVRMGVESANRSHTEGGVERIEHGRTRVGVTARLESGGARHPPSKLSTVSQMRLATNHSKGTSRSVAWPRSWPNSSPESVTRTSELDFIVVPP